MARRRRWACADVAVMILIALGVVRASAVNRGVGLTLGGQAVNRAVARRFLLCTHTRTTMTFSGRDRIFPLLQAFWGCGSLCGHDQGSFGWTSSGRRFQRPWCERCAIMLTQASVPDAHREEEIQGSDVHWKTML